jgi:hypothetical protein
MSTTPKLDALEWDQGCCGGGHQVTQVMGRQHFLMIKRRRITGEYIVRTFSADKSRQLAGPEPMSAEAIEARLA